MFKMKNIWKIHDVTDAHSRFLIVKFQLLFDIFLISIMFSIP